MTYGVGVLNRFIYGKHPENKLIHKNGIDWCTDVFDKFVVCNQAVSLGDKVVRCYTPANFSQKSITINIYMSYHQNVAYVTETGVKKCGTLNLDLSELSYQQSKSQRREIQTEMIFGGTEIQISALDITTGKCVNVEIDFFK